MSKPEQYKTKPVVITACKFTYPPSSELKEFMGDAMGRVARLRHPDAIAEMEVKTLEDGRDNRVVHVATEGDYVVRGLKGDFYPVKPDIFNAKYKVLK